ncbi:2,3-bisphosphoglycerate-independent phosphoglycerate mutase 2 [Methanocaldococcus lauensis]|uniref:2,3-bisphosphoglycerate-independent phosphoglycerate mutase 2 n=1 Tax=Methanocaldococcus lauensis TaxID=2546128 RepID=A0A8D6PVD1_9EURY|nr:2,3-bisphosphoglycerate-independent phosphoglycerate mutase [Methanocaldococcus lauensis]CAB3288674.1 2,3-bisphosphoglycerate-independent phosphoglycerate mutase 2 [Methanocaldococcus lauensis]
MRAILILLDGLGDRGCEILDNKTPLQFAKTPNLDKLAENGMCGLMTTYKEGIPLGTEVAHFLLWGYSLEEFPGRGVIEALGEDIEIEENAIYLRASLGFVKKDEKGFLVVDRRAKDISREEIENLINSLPTCIDGYKFELFYSFDVHFILKIKEKNGWISDKISDSDPFYKNRYVMKVQPIKELCKSSVEYNKAKDTARALNKYLLNVYKTLQNHKINRKRRKMEKMPANFLLTKWASRYKKVESFKERWGMNAVVLGSSSVFKGLAKFLGMDFIKIESFEEGINLIPELNYDFIHLHTKETDEAAHTKNPLNKVKVIEKIDKLIGNLKLNDDDLLIITADHSTPSVGDLIHSGESVPIIFYGKNVRIDNVKEFNEIACSNGHLRIRGEELMHIILNYTNKALLYGLRAGNRLRYYIPKDDDIELLKE